MTRPVLAYVFWHWRDEAVRAEAYDEAQRAFHDALAGAPPAGYLRSFSSRVVGAPWAAGGREAHEDWYLVDDFAALGTLNRDAVTAQRAAPHDAAAAVAAGGTGGLYRLMLGSGIDGARFAHWFGKPTGLAYDELWTRLAPLVERAGGSLWIRQMVLGPAPELCLRAPKRMSLPPDVEPRVVPLEPIWPSARR